MSYPKHNMYIMFIDLPLNEFNSSKVLFLPLKKKQKYYSKLGNGSKINLYLRVNDFPTSVKKLFENIINEMSKNIFYFLEDSSAESICPSLEEIETCFKTLKCKQSIRRWIKLIKHLEKWDSNHASNGKRICLYMCAILLHFVISEPDFKKQFRLL
jgi:hypothetical protein